MDAIVVSERDLVEKYGMSEAEVQEMRLDSMQREQGKWPKGKTTAHAGRPPLFENDELASVTFKIRKSSLQAIDSALADLEESRSDFLRKAADERLERLSSS